MGSCCWSVCDDKYVKEMDPYYEVPPQLPVPLDKVKEYLRLPAIDTSQDQTLTSIQLAIAQSLENEFNLALVPTLYHKTQTDFPCTCIQLLRRPTTEIVSLRYLNKEGIWVEIPVEEYMLQVDHKGYGSVIYNCNFKVPCDLAPRCQNVDVEFNAGYAIDQLPYYIELYILRSIGELYNSRGECVDTSCNGSGLPCGAFLLLRPLFEGRNIIRVSGCGCL